MRCARTFYLVSPSQRFGAPRDCDLRNSINPPLLLGKIFPPSPVLTYCLYLILIMTRDIISCNQIIYLRLHIILIVSFSFDLFFIISDILYVSFFLSMLFTLSQCRSYTPGTYNPNAHASDACRGSNKLWTRTLDK